MVADLARSSPSGSRFSRSSPGANLVVLAAALVALLASLWSCLLVWWLWVLAWWFSMLVWWYFTTLLVWWFWLVIGDSSHFLGLAHWPYASPANKDTSNPPRRHKPIVACSLSGPGSSQNLGPIWGPRIGPEQVPKKRPCQGNLERAGCIWELWAGPISRARIEPRKSAMPATMGLTCPRGGIALFGGPKLGAISHPMEMACPPCQHHTSANPLLEKDQHLVHEMGAVTCQRSCQRVSRFRGHDGERGGILDDFGQYAPGFVNLRIGNDLVLCQVRVCHLL